MGKKPAEIQREIAQQRSTIERRLHALEDRVADDVRDAGSAVSDQVGERTHLKEYADQRPLTTVAGAFGAGVVLGMMSDRGKSGRRHRGGRRGSYDNNGGGGLFDELMGAASGALGGSLQTEVRQLFRDVLGTDGRDGRASTERYDADRLDTGALGQMTKTPEQFRP